MEEIKDLLLDLVKEKHIAIMILEDSYLMETHEKYNNVMTQIKKINRKREYEIDYAFGFLNNYGHQFLRERMSCDNIDENYYSGNLKAYFPLGSSCMQVSLDMYGTYIDNNQGQYKYVCWSNKP